jgi:hypothetical protein
MINVPAVKKITCLLTLLIWQFCPDLAAQGTVFQYLSGTGPDDAVPWEFYCTAGSNSGKWTTIPVPSNWEFHGFGTYNYGHDKNKGKEEGWYRHRFNLPASARDKQVSIVFEGSMTDTYVSVNGRPAGPVHQGAFYRFQYDISSLIKPGKENVLEVKVAKESSNFSVNQAERDADYWVFGGIYRPVYLAISPRDHIVRTAIDARANGSFRMQVVTSVLSKGIKLQAHLLDLKGKPVAESYSTFIQTSDTLAELHAQVNRPRLWNAEQPNLYQVAVELVAANGQVVHTVRERFGFRTIDVRRGDGIYINGNKVIMKGVNRHCTWPSTGKTLSRAQSLQDALLIKEMNMNAVRMSHYPPDKHFLEICDSLGLYVLNELAGWQKAYDTIVGTKLVKELVTRDVNHPCVILWANGNEGGFNRALIPLYAQWDIQKREVYLPWDRYGKFETKHYPDFNYVMNSSLYDKAIFMPTEFMHGLYDGGHGAGLEDFWNTMMQKPNAAGGFLWNFSDEGVLRKDLADSMDVKGNQGTDGILGPFREKEGSFYTVKELWSPIQVQQPALNEGYDGRLLVTNTYNFLSLEGCRLRWELLYRRNKKLEGEIWLPDIQPGERRLVHLPLPAQYREAEILVLAAVDHSGRALHTWQWPLVSAEAYTAKQLQLKTAPEPILTFQEGRYHIVQQGDLQWRFDTTSALLQGIIRNGQIIPLTHGPLLAGEQLPLENWTRTSTDSSYIIQALYVGASTMEVTWTFRKTMPPQLTYRYVQTREVDYQGITFRFPDSALQSVEWLGKGPYRVWKNRMKGPQFGYWQKAWNNTVTGESWEYPEFKGYHADVYEATLHTRFGTFSVLAGNDPYFLQLLKPQAPKGAFNENNAPPFPDGDLGFLQSISAIGTKFQQANVMGPQSQKNVFLGTAPLPRWKRDVPNKLLNYTPSVGVLWFDFKSN